MKLKKLTALAVSLIMALSMAACGGDNGGTAEGDVTTTKAAETVKDEIEKAETTAEKEETTAPETEDTTEATTTEPPVEIVEPPAEDFEYHYDAAYKGAIITKYNGEATAIRIPTELDGDPVVQFVANNPKITYAEIPNDYTGWWAFTDCSNLKSVTIPNSVTFIGQKAFYGCKSLESITIPDSVTEISACAFQKCTKLTEVVIPDSVTLIYDYAFAGCTNLENITIPNGVTLIGGECIYELRKP